ncbi:glutathione S-transferase family protein [Anianabacter salinae]|uniref:glutathione S-transferase family protein n=1 Tax=Anianabacter salinae TaxID=2851023 RepID=UPI00225E443E|nr:glutathione S-transferase C-terminal domain-containing protein [Anianabacter salinae]MBV0913657.1 glutathione S-transferase C-terminal domain-containing protein [Anianabacter salinae]
MGLMLKGEYLVDDPKPDTDREGEFRRASSVIRHWITMDGPFPWEKGRYHLYAAWNCPWAHRALLARTLLGFEDAIGVSYAKPRRSDQGWIYDKRGQYADRALRVSALHEVYARQSPAYTGRVTVPVLFDKTTQQIVSNESADIVRMLGTLSTKMDLLPAGLAPEVEDWNRLIYSTVNNGVYKAGFARTQDAYDRAVTALFETLDKIEDHLATHDWLAGGVFTEADLRLFPTLARFDVAYHYAFKCNIRRLTDYPNLWRYARRIYHMPGVSETVKFDIYKYGYFSPSELRNPLGIVPKGPVIDWSLD